MEGRRRRTIEEENAQRVTWTTLGQSFSKLAPSRLMWTRVSSLQEPISILSPAQIGKIKCGKGCFTDLQHGFTLGQDICEF